MLSTTLLRDEGSNDRKAEKDTSEDNYSDVLSTVVGVRVLVHIVVLVESLRRLLNGNEREEGCERDEPPRIW
jgi:hypothetical protein